MTDPASNTHPLGRGPRAEHGLDAYRAVVVLMMFAVHARRLQTSREGGAFDRALDGLMWSEPYIAASFLFIAGFSLVLSMERRKSGWARWLAGRAALLFVLSLALFVPQYGLELPDLVVSSGILSAIAISIGLTGLALVSPRPDPALVALALAVLAVTFALDRTGATIPGLNAGPGGAFPLVFFTAVGALLARLRRRIGNRALALAALASAPAFLLALVAKAPWITERASFYRSHGGELALVELFSDAPRHAVKFWNHSAIGALGLVLPLVATLGFLVWVGPRVARLGASAPLWLLGCHALAAYVAHLGLLGVIELAHLSPPSAGFTWAVIALLALGCTGLGLGLESERISHLRRSGLARALLG